MTPTRIVLALLIMTSQVVSQPTEQPAAAVSTHQAPVAEIIVTGDDTQRQRVETATAVFATLGMPLPNLEIRFWNTTANCDDYEGLFRPSSLPWTIEICSDLAYIVPHELGHAWERANLTDTDRQTYMETQGFDVWQDPSIDPRLQAIENIALVIQQVISRGGPTGRPNIDIPFDLVANLATNQTPIPTPSALDYLLGFSGVRWGEAVAVRRRRCHLSRSEIEVRESAGRANGKVDYTLPKTHQVGTIVPGFLSRRLTEHLLEYVPDRPEALLSPNPNPVASTHRTKHWRLLAPRRYPPITGWEG